MGKLKIIIIVCGIIVVGTIGTIAIISNNINSKTNNINSKTQNQILTTAPSKASTNESVAKSETENKTSANSATSNNSASESSSNQSQESTNQVTATNTTSNTSNSTSSTISTSTNNATTSKTSNNNSNISDNNNSKQSNATFSMVTINKNCNLYFGPNKNDGPGLKLTKGQTFFILNNNPNYPIPKGWFFARTTVTEGYLPITDFSINSQTKYRLDVTNQTCNLLSAPNKNATPVILQVTKKLPAYSRIFVPINNNINGWSSAFISNTLNTFIQGYIPTSNLTAIPSSRVEAL